VRTERRPGRRGALLVGTGAAVVLALLAAGLSLILPGVLSRNYDAKSLASLRRQAVQTRQAFSALLASLEARQARFDAADLPAEAAQFFPLFREARLDAQNEGIALSNGDGLIEAWYGNVLSPADQIDREDLEDRKRNGGTFLIRSKASVYLVAFQPLGDGGRMLVHFERLAFIPQVRSTYIREFHALRPALRRDFAIDYWDFREDVAGFEKFFARHQDEFPGEPRQKNEIQTLFFPLRNEKGRIMATVTLASPSLTSRLTAAREDLRLVLLLALIAAAGAAVAFAWSSPGFRQGRDPVAAAAGAVLLAGARILALPLGQLERVQSLSLFQPAVAGFASWRGLTQSPADIFLTALTCFGLAVCLAVCVFRSPRERGTPLSVPAGILAHLAAAALTAGAVPALYGVVRRGRLRP
jgi:hypothetical protein